MPLDRKDMREYMRKYRLSNPQKSYASTWAKKNPSKVVAQAKVEAKKRSGEVSRGGACSQCGSTKDVEVHHDTYEGKGRTRKLCRMCHAKTKPNTN